MNRRDSIVLSIAAAAIGFAAADTYVVVLALPDMMLSVGLSVTELQRAAPIISGFLLGYVGVLPLIGRVSDLRGRTPVLLGSLLLFAFGSVVTATGYNLDSIVVGRFLQGIGGGGLIPPTLALIADRWPPERRGVPLGVIGSVQEFGSVLGPLLGAAILSLGTWHDIFWVNCLVALVLAAALWWVTGDRGSARDLLGWTLLALAFAAFVLIMIEPTVLTTGVTSGLAFLPVSGSSRWLTPLAFALYGLLAAFVLRQATARRPLVNWRSWRTIGQATDLIGAAGLTIALAAVILTFATAEPEKSALSEDAWWLLPIAAAATLVFVWRQRSARSPLIPRGTLRTRPAWGAVVVSFLVGAALIATLVDVPVFARMTTARDSQLDAALVLMRFLLAVPIGALIGGWLLRRFSPALLATLAMAGSCAAFIAMARWDAQALDSTAAWIVLIVNGLGFGLAIAPVNEALLNHTDDDVHGVASSLIVVARMVGMLIGISMLTLISLRALHIALTKIAPVNEVCHNGSSVCSAYARLVLDAGVHQLNVVFATAAVLAGAAAVLSGVLLRSGRANVAV